jgi:hypothetical protein
MPDITDATLETEVGFDYSQSYEYTYGIAEDNTQSVTGTATVSTAASGTLPAAANSVTGASTPTTTATGTLSNLIGALTGVNTATVTASGTIVGDGAFIGTAAVQTSASSTITSIGEVAGINTATVSATGTLPRGVSDVIGPEWRLIRDTDTVETELYNVEVEDTFNPFGDYAIAKIDDTTGTKFDQYERATRVAFQLSTDGGLSFTELFEGYVVERRELEQQGADALEIEAYSFDQFLRRNKVSNDQSGKQLVSALEDIIKTDTPVAWNANNVTVGDSQELTKSYRGEPVEAALKDLAFKSVNEEFGVNDAQEFFFRPREITHIDRGIDNTQWFNYDIPELAKESINEVEVFFDDGNRSVIVDDGTDKLDLQNNLNLPDPGTQKAEINRPNITDIADAEDEGRQFLNLRNATLTGTVTTFGLFAAEPGDTIDITITPRGIDGEFQIAAVNYKWGRDETELTIVEKKGNDNAEVLFRLTEAVDRVSLRSANRDGTKNRITTTNATALVETTTDADGTIADAEKVVNDGRNVIRDGWVGDRPPVIDTIALGSGGAGLSRSNTDLTNQIASASPSKTLPDSTTVEYSASFTESGVEEVGLFSSAGELIYRATFDAAISVDGTVSVTLTVSNDSSVSRGVLTTDGQTAVRDILADNSPNAPDEYAYGSGTSDSQESDTALDNELIREDLTEVLIQSADSSFDSIVEDFTDTDPVAVNGKVEHLQSAFVQEGEDGTTSGLTGTETDVNFSDGEAGFIEPGGGSFEWTFTTPYTIPAKNVVIKIRDRIDDSNVVTIPEMEWYLDGIQIADVSGDKNFPLQWNDTAAFGGYNNPESWDTKGGGDLTAGETHTLHVESSDSNGNYEFDLWTIYDDRFNHESGGGGNTFDNTVDSDNGHLDDPQLAPHQTDVSFATASTRREVTEARAASTWNNVEQAQYIELANDGSTFTRVTNSDAASVTFSSANEDVDTNIGLSRGGGPQSATPRFGFQPQELSVWELFANPAAVLPDGIGEATTRAIVSPNTIDGETVAEAGLFGDNTLLTRHRLAAFDVLSGQRIASAEQTGFDNA